MHLYLQSISKSYLYVTPKLYMLPNTEIFYHGYNIISDEIIKVNTDTKLLSHNLISDVFIRGVLYIFRTVYVT